MTDEEDDLLERHEDHREAGPGQQEKDPLAPYRGRPSFHLCFGCPDRIAGKLHKTTVCDNCIARFAGAADNNEEEGVY